MRGRNGLVPERSIVIIKSGNREHHSLMAEPDMLHLVDHRFDVGIGGFGLQSGGASRLEDVPAFLRKPLAD